jgi:hypothetical protein
MKRFHNHLESFHNHFVHFHYLPTTTGIP